MRTFLKALLVLAITAGPTVALAQEYDYGPPVDADQPEVQPPAAPAPAQLPPPPPATTSYPVQAPPAGQWTYTSQYGWVWLPYAQDYTYVPADGGYPSVYAYYPSYGWRWLAAPWIFSVGPRPFWGVYGPARFVWYSRPWFTHHVSYRSGYGGYGYRHHGPARVYGGHSGPGWSGGGYRHGDSARRGPAAQHPGYRPSGGGDRHDSGNRPSHSSPGAGAGRGGHSGGGNSGGHSARPAGHR